METARTLSTRLLTGFVSLALGSSAFAASTVDTVTVSPDPAYVGDTLTCNYNFTDTESDPDASTLQWDVNGLVVGSASTLSGSFSANDVVTCSVTASDGTDVGNTDSDSVIISNTAPVLSSVDLSPEPAFENDTLVCTPSGGTDADGDTVNYSYSWTVDGIDPGIAVSTLTGTDFDRDQDVQCSVVANDGTDSSSAVSSNTVTISNSVPSVSSVAISPTTATVGTKTLTCSYSFSDADSDVDASDIAWTVDGSFVGTSSSLTAGYPGGSVVVCTVTPNDETDSGTASSATLVVGNTPPTVDAAQFSPDPVYTDDVLSLEVLSSDPDGDLVSTTVAWYVNEVRQVESGISLDGASYFERGDLVRVDITPNDGREDGTVLSVTAVEVANSAPVLDSASIVPTEPSVLDTLSCGPGDVMDVDADEVSEYRTSWFVNGLELVGQSGQTLSAYSQSSSGGTSAGGTDTGDTGALDTGASDTADSGDTGSDSTDSDPNFVVGDSVFCEVVPVDVLGAVGDSVASAVVTIQSDDTGNTVDTGGGSSDTADPGMSAAQRAGESGGFGCGCGDSAGAASAVSIWGLLVALSWRRRRNS